MIPSEAKSFFLCWKTLKISCHPDLNSSVHIPASPHSTAPPTPALEEPAGKLWGKKLTPMKHWCFRGGGGTASGKIYALISSAALNHMSVWDWGRCPVETIYSQRQSWYFRAGRPSCDDPTPTFHGEVGSLVQALLAHFDMWTQPPTSLWGGSGHCVGEGPRGTQLVASASALVTFSYRV